MIVALRCVDRRHERSLGSRGEFHNNFDSPPRGLVVEESKIGYGLRRFVYRSHNSIRSIESQTAHAARAQSCQPVEQTARQTRLVRVASGTNNRLNMNTSLQFKCKPAARQHSHRCCRCRSNGSNGFVQLMGRRTQLE